jgi:hypothetical protein
LQTNVIGLIGQDGRDIALAAHDTEEDAEVAGRVAVGVYGEHEPDETDDGLESDEGGAEAVLVGQIGEEEGARDGCYDWGR